jgi:sodium borate transporter 11
LSDFQAYYNNASCDYSASRAENFSKARAESEEHFYQNTTAAPTPVAHASAGGGPGDLSTHDCRRDTSILYVLLMFGTLWLGLFLYNFRKT